MGGRQDRARLSYGASCGRGPQIVGWNVNGLRALLRKDPKALEEYVKREQPDVLCLGETKVDDTFVASAGGGLLPGYRAHWSHSKAKKGL